MAVVMADRPAPLYDVRCPRCNAFFGHPQPGAGGADLHCYRCGLWFALEKALRPR